MVTELLVEDIGKRYDPTAHAVPAYGLSAKSDAGGSTSVRRVDADNLRWKRQGYYQRNRDLGQVFTVPEGDSLLLSAIVLRTGNSKTAILSGTPGAPVFLQLFRVDGTPVINDNGTPAGTKAEHGYTDNHRADDYLEGLRYESIALLNDGRFPAISPTTQAGGEAGHLRYLRWKLAAPIQLTGGQRYAFIVGFSEAGPDYGFTLGNDNLAADPAAPQLRTDVNGNAWWGIRREGDGTLPPTQDATVIFESDLDIVTALKRESLFAEDHYTRLSPTTNGFPDVDTYRSFEFYLEAAGW